MNTQISQDAGRAAIKAAPPLEASAELTAEKSEPAPLPVARSAPEPTARRRSRTQATMEWVALVAFALVGAAWIYFWQNSAAFDR